MAAFDQATLDRWRALAIVDRDGATVGTIGEFYLDRETGYPTWALVNTGLFGASQTFVPLVHAIEISDGLQVPYEKSHIRDTPKVELHDELSPDEEAALFAHYGVDYQPSPEAPGGVDEGPEPDGSAVTVDAGPGSGEAPGPVAVEPWSGEAPGPVDAERASGEAPGPVPAEPGSVDPAGPVGTGQGSAPPDPSQAVPDEPGTSEAAEAGDSPNPGAGDSAAPDEPGTSAPGEVTRADPDGTDPEPMERGEAGSAGAHDEAPADADRFRTAPDDPDLSRTAPVEPGLPGSTAASPYGPGPTTIEKDADASEHPPDQPLRAPGEAGWAPGAAGTFEEHEPVDRPAGASDRWREAKLAAERDRIARAAAAQPEERSPLERARRRLERLVGVGQESADPEDISPADRDAAERARLARLGFDEDDHRRR